MRLSGRIALFCALALTTGALSAVEKKNVPYYDSTRPAITMGLAGRILTFQTLLKKSFKFEKPLVCENRRGAFFFAGSLLHDRLFFWRGDYLRMSS